jgi:hypothetical protein
MSSPSTLLANQKNAQGTLTIFTRKPCRSLVRHKNIKHKTIIKQLKERERQRNVAKKIKFLQGKLKARGTTMVTIDLGDGKPVDISNKTDMEYAILKNNEDKFKPSHRNAFYHFPLSHDLGFKGVTVAFLCFGGRL